ncbi:response regulator transcription factor [Salegentibacter sp. HM20]
MKNRAYKILLVEDDDSLGYLLSEYLKLKAFDLIWSQTGKKSLELLDSLSFDLIILDVMLPDIDGFELAKRIRVNFPNQAFIFLTARSMKIDVLKGFSLGAVDYLKKPIDEEELVTRIQVLLSRLQPTNAESSSEISEYKLGEYSLNLKNQELVFRGEPIHLTTKEHKLLVYLIQQQGNLCSHKEILELLWGKNDYFNRKSLNVFISHLRKYLSRDDRVSIENSHGKGFKLMVRE